ncbi:hypothetical protein, partial [Mesobacillus sp.]|uniref:hypothetical protein n=1 Tax=Mesobacillus sp. TaxID=2675271 RepID=UPI0039F0F5A4
FDFIGRTEIEMYSRLSRNAETGDSDKEALFASAGGVEVSEFLGGETSQASRGARRWSWTKQKNLESCGISHRSNSRFLFLDNSATACDTVNII